MKIEIDIDSKYSETDVKISAPILTQDIEKIISMMRLIDMRLEGKKNGETYILDAEQILYTITIERKTFIYTVDSMYESDLRLYELEQQLGEKNFIRISKQSLLNLKQVKSLKTEINRKIRVTMQNDKQIMVSRMYADELRNKLGVK